MTPLGSLWWHRDPARRVDRVTGRLVVYRVVGRSTRQATPHHLRVVSVYAAHPQTRLMHPTLLHALYEPVEPDMLPP